MAFKFDSTVNLGHVFTAVTILCAGFAAWSSSQAQMAAIEVRVQNNETKTAGLDALIGVTAQVVSEMRATNAAASARLERLEADAALNVESNRRVYDRVNAVANAVASVSANVAAIRAQLDRSEPVDQ